MVSPRLLIASHLSLALISGFIGWKVRDADYQAHLKKEARVEVKAQQDTRQQEAAHEVISQDHREKDAQQKQQVQVVYRTVTEKVPVYVTRTQFEEKVVAGGGLPAGFVWSYNQSASNSTAPLPTGINPDTPTGIDMSTLAGTTAGNFAMCNSWRTELQQWHEWYNDHASTWPGSIKEGTSK